MKQFVGEIIATAILLGAWLMLAAAVVAGASGLIDLVIRY